MPCQTCASCGEMLHSRAKTDSALGLEYAKALQTAICRWNFDSEASLRQKMRSVGQSTRQAAATCFAGRINDFVNHRKRRQLYAASG
eukprot:2892102-Pleurochrysis_carterae.AAC.1